MPRRPPVGPRTQSWATFLRNHAGAVLACDFFVVVTGTFQRVCVFVILDIATRQIVHWNLTRHPTADWTIQQFRDGLPIDAAYRLVVHDRDGIFAPAVDDALDAMSIRVLKTPVRTPQANGHSRRCQCSTRRSTPPLPPGNRRRVSSCGVQVLPMCGQIRLPYPRSH
jgi:putative transposase